MKSTKILLMLLIVSFFGIMSCDKKDELTNEKKEYNSSTVKEMIYVQNQFDYSTEIFEQVKENLKANGLEYRNFDCADISTTNSFGHFPNTITIDFGDGCDINDSIFISGKIIISMSGFLNHTGNSRTTTYEQFKINGNQLDGTKIVENLGKDDEGYRTISKKIINAHLIYENGETVSYDSDKLFKYTISGTIFNPHDDELIISGSCSGTDIEGNTYNCNINNNLILPTDCGCIVSGEQEMTINNEDTYTLNYGDGTCDNTALLTYPDGTTEEIEVCNN